MDSKVLGYDELLVRLRYFQSDYYTRGQALEVYKILKANSNCLIFNDDLTEKKFYHQLERLKRSESATDIDRYANRFAHALMQIILLVIKADYVDD
ncbi:hypothetical protein [Maribacter polysiphoniae]|uniref:hypothetical protein n=1 Tax=Maribacter polysiphoniae TaxID=429344 RepID=UPI002354FDA4|nr:hypothetical protein [Maribacter polysiphoniae]